MPSTHQISIEGRLDRLGDVRGFVAETGKTLGVDAEILTELQLAVDEAITNVIQHGYQGDGGDREIDVTMSAIDDAVEITIHDQAPPFDGGASAPQLDTPLEQRPYGGMGIYLIQKISDEVDYSYLPGKGNQLRLLKKAAIRSS